MSQKRTELHPWPVIRGFVLQLSSYDVPRVIDAAGLRVDWGLTERQDFSDKMRLAAYRPKIDAAYSRLSENDGLRVAYIVAQKLADLGHGEKLNSALQNIGWRFEDGRLAPSNAPVCELFFPPQSQHDAYAEIREILKKAEKSITLVDPYIDQSTLTLLSSAIRPGMTFRVLTSKVPSDFNLEVKNWREQHRDISLQVRTTKAFHDRFIVVDESFWHVGCSLKDAGNKAFMLSQIEDDGNRRALLTEIETHWDTGEDRL